MIVLNVSTGIKRILNKPADTEAVAVFTDVGNFLVVSFESKKCNAKAFAAVSPNLESGPYFCYQKIMKKITCINAGPNPL